MSIYTEKADDTTNLAMLVVVARRLRTWIYLEMLAEMLLKVDELILGETPRARWQDRMMNRFSDLTGLRLESVVEEFSVQGAGAEVDHASNAPATVMAPEWAADSF